MRRMAIGVMVMGLVFSAVAADAIPPTSPVPDVAPMHQPPSTQFMATCLTLGASVGFSTDSCTQLMIKSRLVQSDVIRYWNQATDAQKQTFASASTTERFDLVEKGVEMNRLTKAAIQELSDGIMEPIFNGRVAAQLMGDVMKPECGPYQLDLIVRSVNGVLEEYGESPARPIAKRGAINKDYAGCLVPSEGTPDAIGDLKKCLSLIFRILPSAQVISSADGR